MPAKNYNSYMNTYMKQRYNKRRLAAIEKLGGHCVECNSSDDLHFHHKDRSTKSMTISRASSISEARWQEELAKCELLCADCHRTHHKADHPHGDAKRYWRGCRCELCRSANTKYNRRFRSTR